MGKTPKTKVAKTSSTNHASGSMGANFYLEWVADTTVNEPIVEAIMLGAYGTQGYSWNSQGIVAKLSDKNK